MTSEERKQVMELARKPHTHEWVRVAKETDVCADCGVLRVAKETNAND